MSRLEQQLLTADIYTKHTNNPPAVKFPLCQTEEPE